MKPRTVLVLAVLVAGLGAFIWFWERHAPSTSERAESGKKLLTLEVPDVEAVTIAAQGRAVRLERDRPPAPPEGVATTAGAAEAAPAASWRIAAPIQAPADRWAVERLIESFGDLEKQRTLESPDRKALGLEEPRAVVTFERVKDKGEPVVVEVGMKLPAAAAMAVAVRGAPTAAVVTDAIYNDLIKAPGDWRSREVFSAERDAIERLTLGQPPVLLGRRGESFWLEAPLVDRADRDLVNTLLSDLASLRAAEFLDQPLDAAEMGLQPPAQTLEVVLKGREAPFRLELGAAVAPAASAPSAPSDAAPADAARRYARVGDQLFTTESKLGEAIARPAAGWRSPAWSGLDVFRIDAARLEGPATKSAEPIAVERAAGDWRRGAVTIPFTTVSDLLYAITGAKSTALLTKAEATNGGADLSSPTLTATLTANDKSEEVLTLYPALPGGRVPAMAGGRDVVLLLDAAAVKEIEDKLEAVKKAEPQPGKPEEKDEGA